MKKNPTTDKLMEELQAARQRVAELEEKLAAEAKQNAQAFSFIAQSHDGIALFDEQGMITVWNPAQEKITGISAAQAIGAPYWDMQLKLLTPEARARLSPAQLQNSIQKMFEASKQRALKETEEVEIQTADGARKFLLVSSFPIKGSSGYQIGTIMRDVTENKRADRALRASEERYQQFIALAFEAISRTEFDQPVDTSLPTEKQIDLIYENAYIAECNQAMANTYNATMEELVGMRLIEAHGGRDNPVNREALRRFIAAGYQSVNDETVEVDKDGKIIWLLSATMGVVQDGKLVRMWNAAIDITERKRAENKLRESEAQYRLLAENVSDVIWVLDLQEGRFRYVSQSVTRLRGYGVEEALLQPMSASLTPASAQYLQRVLPERLAEFQKGITKVYVDEIEQPCKDGSTVWTETTTRFKFDPESGRLEVYGVSRDIAARKQAEEALAKNHAQFLKFAAQVPGMLYQFQRRPDGTYCVPFTTESIYDIFYCSPEEVREDFAPVARVIHPEDIPAMNLVIEESGRNLTPFRFEYRVITPDGSLRWVHAQSMPEKQADGSIIWSGFNTDITERKQTEEALKKSERVLRLFVEHSPAAIAMFDREMRYIVASRRYLTDYRLGEQDLTGHSHYEVFPEMDAARKEIHRRCLAGETAKCDEDPLPRADGTLDWVRYELLPWREINGEIGGLIFFSEVITGRKQAEKDLQIALAKYKTLFDVFPLGITVTDAAGNILETNTAAEKLLGISKEEQTRREIDGTEWRIIRPDGMPMSADEYASVRALKEGRKIENVEMGILKPDQSVTWLNVTATPLPLEGYGVAVTYGDVTERKLSEEQIVGAERRYRALIENAPDGVVLIGMEGRFKYASPAALRIFGYREEDVLAGNPNDLTHPEDLPLVLTEIGHLVENPAYIPKLEYRFLHQNGEWRWIESTFSNMLAVPGLEAIVINFRDIHGRKNADAALHRHAAQLTIAAGIESELAALLDEQAIIAKLAGGIRQLFPNLAGIFISRFDAEREMIKAAYGYQDGADLDVANLPELPLAPEGKGTQSKVIRSRQPLRINSELKASFTNKNLLLLGDEREPQSALYVPILAQDKVFGLMQLQSYDENHFTEDDTRLLTLIGNAAAISLENARLYAVAQNEIAERRQAEENLRASEGRANAMLQAIPDMMFRMNRAGVYLDYNADANELYAPSGQIVGKHVREILPAELARQVEEKIAATLGTERVQTLEYQLEIPESGRRIFEARLAPRGEDEILAVVRDITALKAAQGALLELNRTLEEKVNERAAEVKDLYDNAPNGYHSLDAEGRIVMVNQTEANWLGYAREDLIGHQVSEFLTPSSIAAFRENFPEFKQRGYWRDLELEFIRRDRSVLPVSINAVAVYNELGEYALSRSTLTDNTDRKAAEEAMRHANEELARALRMKDEFLATMSHELRTPLTGILGLSESLQMEVYGALTEKQKSTLANIEASGRHLLDLINDILDVSKTEAGKLELRMEACSLGEICQSSIHLTKGMAGKKRQIVNFTMSPAHVSVNGDARRLKQVLINLLSNAVKFTPEGGSLGLDVIANSRDNIVYLTVWDTGIGIAPENIKKLFQPFMQIDSSLARAHTGTGLGLALVRRLVDLHGGSVEVQSTLGQGSRFVVSLPCLPEEDMGTATPEILNLRFRRALIVEDNQIDAEHLARCLTSLGIEPVAHSRGNDVLERAIETQPDVIFLDLRLPDASGWDILPCLKADERTKHIPVIITSVSDDKQKAADLNADGYLVKFFAPTDVRAALEHLRAKPRENVKKRVVSDSAIGMAVMVVDDNETNIEALTDFLTAQGFFTTSVTSGVDFLARVSDVQPDAVIMDIQMPGLDGLETIRRLRAFDDPRLAALPVIAVTALAMPGDRELCLKAGADEYISKPFRLLEVKDMLLHLAQGKEG